MKTFNFQSSFFVIWVIMLATFLLKISSVGGHATQIAKLTFAASLWAAVIFFPYQYLRKNDFGNGVNILLRIIILLAVVATLRSVFGEYDGKLGNKWFTLFGNEECMFMLLAPCFMYLVVAPNSVSILKSVTQMYLVLGTLAIVTGYYVVGGALWFSGLLFPYMRFHFKLLVFFSVAMSVFGALFAENTSRSNIVVLVVIVVAYGSVYFLHNKKLIWAICMTMILAPLIYSVLMLIDPNYSIFSIILDQVLQQTGDETMATDTRSFLFWEMAEDLGKNNAWLFGKGALSNYYSYFFSRSTSENADVAMRIGVEVTFLQLMLRSGIVYVVAYYSLLTMSVVKALRYAQSKFVLAIAVTASGWSLFSCMSYVNGCNFLHVGFFLMLGCCVSQRWLNYTDTDIRRILK